ncbi:hypothetical protein M9Y10_019117 [Tritrichomonas musculus]|uniref:Uncharacterized protein n=1 Tax=Tritrichomonas musculus TaxID=1915356 RepID=A0ABR2GL36_9EUKA
MIREKLNKNNNREETTKENIQAKEEKTRQTEEKEHLLKEVARLKNYLSLLKKDRTKIEFVNITDYEELSYIGEGGESSD